MEDIAKQPELVTQAQDAVAEARDGSTQNPVRYSRKSYKHWTDEDFDTSNTREEVLLDAAQGDVRVNKNKWSGQNKVTGGEWITPYSGEKVRHRSGIQIDHAVPLYWADQHGANEWSPEKKQQFANDQENLVAAGKLQNQVKGASGTDKYLPPNSAYVPEYVDLWSSMLAKYPSLQMSDEEAATFSELEAGVEQYKAMDARYQNGEIDIKELNAFARDTFKNDKHTAVYLQKQYDNSSPDAKIAATQRSQLFAWAQENKDIKYKGSSNFTPSPRPLRDPTFMQSLDASFSSMNSIAQMMDMEREWNAQAYGQNGISRAILLDGVPARFHGDVIDASEEYNDDTALIVRDNILEDLANNAVFDSMPWYAQIGFGIPAVLADPLTLVPAVGVAKTTIQATRAVRAWQTHGAFKGLAVGSTWFAAGATESAIQASPRLAADYTYNSSDYILDTVAGGLLGAGMLAGVKGASKIKQVWNKDGNTAKATELDDTVEVWDDDLLDLTGEVRTNEIERRQNIKKLKDEYADTIATKNTKLQTELKDHILEKDTTSTPEPKRTVGESEQVAANIRLHSIKQELDTTNLDRGRAKDVDLDYMRDLEKEQYLLKQLLAGNPKAKGILKELEAGVDLHARTREVLAWSPLDSVQYTSKAVTEETPNTATLATEIHNGQQILVEVETQPGVEVAKPKEVIPNADNVESSLTSALDGFRQSGELEADQVARKSNNLMQSILRGLNKVGMTDLSTVLAGSKSDAVKFVAARITEVGQGFGGKKSRKVSAAVMRDSKFRSAQMEMVPAYKDTITEYVSSQGKGKLNEFRARNEAGVDNPMVEQFNREFITLQELRRQGDNTDHINPAVVKFAESWNKSMDVSFNHLIDAGVAGFSKQRKISDYYTQSWLPTKLGQAEKKHGKDKIIDVLAKGYKTAAHQTSEMSDSDARKLANRIYDHIKKKKEQNQMDDEFISTAGQDARSKNRLNINTTAELDGVSVMDLLDTDVIGVGTKYHNRMAGWASLSQSTDGVVNSDKAVQALIKRAEATGASKTEIQYLSDVMEMMLGKPVRGGLSPVLREFKDLAALSQLGGKGMAQLAETGQVITRGIIKAFSDPRNLNKMLKDAGAKGDASALSKEAQQLSYMTDDMEWLERQSTHIDTAESIGKVAVVSNWMASKITGGNRLKANSGRLLGKISGFNMIRRSQSRVAQAALVREVADQLLRGESKIGVDRLKDIGILDSHGKNPWLASVLRQFATLDTDGGILKMNIDKWPKKQADQMRYALMRDEAQQIQRTMIGELPGWMNSPMASLFMQYREMPLVAMNKALGKAAAFADREAVVGVVLSSMTAAMAMSGRQLVVAGSDATNGQEFRGVDLNLVDTAKYINAAGMYPDLYDLVMNDGVEAQQNGSSKAWTEFAMRQVPTLGLAKGYVDTVNSKDAKQLIDNTQTLLPLGNTMLGDAMFTFILEKM